MVTVTSRENETLDSKLTRTLILLLFFCHEKVYAKDDRILPFEKALSFSAVKTQYTDFGLSGTMQFYLFYFIRSEINAIFWKAIFWKYNPQKIVRYQELRKHLKRKGEERWKYKT